MPALAPRFTQGERLDIQAFEALCPNVTRRTLQRDLTDLEEKGLVRSEGETNNRSYWLVRA